MKKKIMLACLLTSLLLCGCGAKSDKQPSVNEDSNHVILVSDNDYVTSMGDKVVEKPKDQKVSAPADSISFEQACTLLDGCEKKDFYLPESLKNYQKYYFGTVEYNGSQYYSIYPYIEANGKHIYAGTNCLVAVSGEYVLAQNWMGGYENIELNSADKDKDIQKMYPDAKITPNKALAVLAQKEKALGLKRPIEDYVFETDEKLIEANGIPCYCFTPKLEYTDHIDLLKVYYVTADGSNTIFASVTGAPAEFTELK